MQGQLVLLHLFEHGSYTCVWAFRRVLSYLGQWIPARPGYISMAVNPFPSDPLLSPWHGRSCTECQSMGNSRHFPFPFLRLVFKKISIPTRTQSCRLGTSTTRHRLLWDDGMPYMNALNPRWKPHSFADVDSALLIIDWVIPAGRREDPEIVRPSDDRCLYFL